MTPIQHSAIDIQQFPTLPAGQTWTYLPPKARFAYYAGADRIAMRVKNTTDTVNYLLTDHLGSTSVTTDANGAKVADLRSC